jgi:pSer/pThr/pTyr-binding forkhead associated (FHA) protein
MTKKPLSMTEIARIAKNQRSLALKQQDSALVSGFSLMNDDDSHLDLTTLIRFVEACGGPPPYVLERIDEAGNVARYSFERPFLIAGRSAACDVACRLRSLSFRHVYFQYFQGTVWWFDLDSRSGVFQDGQKRRAGCLLPGMTIGAGDYSLRLVEPAKKLTGPESPSGTPHSGPNTLIVGQQPGLPQVSLEFENGKIGSEEKKLWPIENSITLLGRRSCCDLRFADESMSRVHASLVLTQEGLWIVDLLGRGGTKVNGVPSAYAYLQNGSLIEMGGYKMRVRYAGRDSQPHPEEAFLNEEARRPRRRSGSRKSQKRGSVSEDLLYELVTTMAEMQKQLFDQSQLQIGLLVQMLGSIHKSQQDMLRNEMNRVHEISREMHDLQLRLMQQQSPPAGGFPKPTQPKSAEATPADAQSLPEEDLDTEAEAQGGPEDSLPAPSLFSQEDHEPLRPMATPDDLPRAKSNEVQDHAILFQRMQNLDRERNTRLQKIFRAFRGSS